MVSNQKYIGTKLKKDIISSHGTLLLSTDTILTEEMLEHLSSLNYVLADEDIDVVSDYYEEKTYIRDASEDIKLIFDQIRYKRSIPLRDIQIGVIPSIQKAVETQHVSTLLRELHSINEHTYRHTIGVGVLSTLIGKWIRLPQKDLAHLTMAATLHDIGKSKIPDEILNKPGRLTNDEYELVKKHTIFGYELIKNTVGATHRMALTALQHHEREDGGGYPFRLKSNKIDFFSKVVAVADIFHAMSSERADREAIPFYQVIDQMSEDKFGKLEPRIVKIFIEKMMEMMVNHEVRLNDNRVGKIILINSSDPVRPLINVEGEFLDLRYHSDIKIEKISV
ncbi:HD-GYP domain-containing protein [Bacillus horti]|uniref:HD-GYP domain-containing protein (C-di-GMP phosphodiesterase class II) n=1 Tax=Caldalkalibacillus horti TaxID=77523 RepID=A0ABT9VTU1_9BACI|nr:HD-GYP domain-containing protein [Bacillus horti]MDQ0164399.1 HD-GYP domain-containing protein (c-di-GMP phosphodiesterase class II) [Bacillus horti]